MHEIKFRGMDVNGHWHYGNLTVLPRKVNKIDAGSYISNRAGMPFAFQVRPETVGQYTGVKDVIDTEIYDGDHLFAEGNLDAERQYVGTVEWDEEDARWETVCLDGRRYEFIPADLCIVKGNKHQDPLGMQVAKS